jgi:hypothetical protein
MFFLRYAQCVAQLTTSTTTAVVLLSFFCMSIRVGVVHTNSISLQLSPDPLSQQAHLQDPGIRVYVTPRRTTIRYGETVSIRCKARGGSTVADMPFIRFSVSFSELDVARMNAKYLLVYEWFLSRSEPVVCHVFHSATVLILH